LNFLFIEVDLYLLAKPPEKVLSTYKYNINTDVNINSSLLVKWEIWRHILQT